MKIVIMNTVPYGSTGRISRNIGKRAEKAGDKVYYIYGWTKGKRRSQDENEMVATSFFSKLFHMVAARLTGLDAVYSYWSTRKTIGRLKKIKPDIIHMHIMHDYFLNLKLLYRYFEKTGVKVIWTFHDCWAFTGGCMYFTVSECSKWKDGCKNCVLQKNGFEAVIDSSQRMWKLKRQGLTSMKNLTVTVPSRWLEQVVRQSFYQDFPIKTICNGIDLEKFRVRKSDFRDVYSIPNKYVVLGVAFDWGYRKGLDVFIKLADILPEEYQIVLVGIRKEHQNRLPHNVIAIPKTSNQEELIEIYSTADVFVNPTREEVFGMVNIEALACGTPVIMFDTGGAPEGIDESCGVVVKTKTAEALAKEIVRVCTEKPFCSDSCVERAKKFDESICYQKYVELYHSL